ncbi:putative glycosyl hydrolase [Arcticibacter svalbardensis MN12-7]|uniref:Putative glycosyl hydrolase n=2 Tax=Arcticibacter TaxID=1288026 RepID=R9GMS6_9SPHI|nr:putative glycosyl hydrolase [Arcticibacter svalbardensis MN12-7]
MISAYSASAQNKVITIKNPATINRDNELIILKRDFIEKKVGILSGEERISIRSAKGSPLFIQFDDLTDDGNWDEVAFLYSFKGQEQVDLPISKSDIQIKPIIKAHVRQRIKNADDSFGLLVYADSVPAGQPNTDFTKQTLPSRLTEGPAWENDKVGFRIYMDVRNIKDIWGKTTSEMMMDTVGVDPKVIYHHLDKWGMDILAVGKSLGAGSLALKVPLAGKADTLVRLGGQNMGKMVYKMIADGPIRAVFALSYPEWNVLGNGKLASLTEQISIWGGQYFYQSEVTVKNAPKGAELVSGIVNLKSKKSSLLSYGSTRALYTFDTQSENKDQLGMALMVSKSNFVGIGQTPNVGSDILNTYTLQMPIRSKAATTYRFYSAWEASDSRFKTFDSFKKYLTDEAALYNAALMIK